MDGIKHELRAIFFLWKREMIRFFRSKSRVIGSLGMPFFFLAILGTGLNGVMGSGGADGVGGNYMEFMSPGVLAMVIMFASVFSGTMVIVDRQFGFLKETLVAPVNRTSIVIGKALGGATAAVFQGLLMLVIALLLGVSFNIANLPLAIAAMFLISMAFVSLGIAIASLVDDMHGFQLIMNFLIMPMFFLSGALFPMTSAPDVVKAISYVDPLTYAVEILRFLLVGQSGMSPVLSLGVLVGFFAATAGLATYLFGKIES